MLSLVLPILLSTAPTLRGVDADPVRPLRLGVVSSVFADDSGLYLTGDFTYTQGPDADRVTFNVLRVEGGRAAALGSMPLSEKVIAGSKVTAIARTSDGSVFIHGNIRIGGESQWAIARYRGGSWSVLSGDDFNAYKFTALGRHLFVFNDPPKPLKGTTSGIVSYDTASGQWSDLGGGVWTSLPRGKKQRGIVYEAQPHGTRVYVAGSFDRAGDSPARDTAFYDTQTQRWTALPRFYPEPTVNGIGQVGEEPGCMWDVAVTKGGRVFVIGENWKTHTRNQRLVGLLEGDRWRVVGVLANPPGGGVAASTLIASGDDLYLAGDFADVSGQVCDGLAVFRDGKFVPAKLGGKAGIWSFTQPPAGTPAEGVQWPVRWRTEPRCTGGYPGFIALTQWQDNSTRGPSPVALFDIAQRVWVEMPASVEP